MIPPVVENDDVAVEKLIPLVLPTERSEPGVVVPIPILPVESVEPTPVLLTPKRIFWILSCPFAVALANEILSPILMF